MALQELLSGNRRYVEGDPRNPDQEAYHREQQAKGQTPSVVIVSCSDSRVPPSVVFDQGLGFIFSVRTPGHIVDDIALGSIEYAVQQLGTQLVMVLGHTRCGAVTLAMEEEVAMGYVGRVQKMVRDVIAWADGGEVDVVDVTTVEEAIEVNIRGAMAQIKSSEPDIAPLISSGKVMLVGAVYNLDTGEVRVLE
jgi:carbonic anhydrase